MLYRKDEDSEKHVRSVLQDMLDSIGVEVPQTTAEEVATQIAEAVAKHCTVAEIIEDLLDVLPEKPTDEQQAIIETTAERLFALEEPEVRYFMVPL